MSIDSEFYNLYVEKLLTELTELTKTKVLMASQIAWADKQLKENNELKNKIENANNELVNRNKELEETIARLGNDINVLKEENSTYNVTIRELNSELEKLSTRNTELEAVSKPKSEKKIRRTNPDPVEAESS
jgi:chromosome segregation ATPase